MRRECKKRGIDSLKVVYSKEAPIRQFGDVSAEDEQDSVKESEDVSAGGEKNSVNTSGISGRDSMRRSIPGSTAFVPSVVGLIIAGEVINDLAGIKIR